MPEHCIGRHHQQDPNLMAPTDINRKTTNTKLNNNNSNKKKNNNKQQNVCSLLALVIVFVFRDFLVLLASHRPCRFFFP